MSQPNPNMTYEELQQQVTELLRDMYHPSNQILKEDVPKIIQLFATLCTEVIDLLPNKFNNWSDVPDELLGKGLATYAKKEMYRKGANQTIDQCITQIKTRLAQLTTKNTEEKT